MFLFTLLSKPPFRLANAFFMRKFPQAQKIIFQRNEKDVIRSQLYKKCKIK